MHSSASTIIKVLCKNYGKSLDLIEVFLKKPSKNVYYRTCKFRSPFIVLDSETWVTKTTIISFVAATSALPKNNCWHWKHTLTRNPNEDFCVCCLKQCWIAYNFKKPGDTANGPALPKNFDLIFLKYIFFFDYFTWNWLLLLTYLLVNFFKSV